MIGRFGLGVKLHFESIEVQAWPSSIVMDRYLLRYQSSLMIAYASFPTEGLDPTLVWGNGRWRNDGLARLFIPSRIHGGEFTLSLGEW